MIEKMNKLYLLIHNGSMDKVLSNIQDLGVVHIQQENIDPELFQEVVQKEKKIKDLLKYCSKYDGASKSLSKDPLDLAKDFESLISTIENLNSEKGFLVKDLNNLKPWGRFKRDLLLKLNKEGIDFHFYAITSNQFQKMDLGQIEHQVISEETGQTYFVTIREKLDMEEISLPDTDMEEVEAKLSKINHEIDLKTKEALSFGAYKEDLNKFLLKLTDELVLRKAKQGISDHYDSFSSAIGWIPESISSKFESDSKKIEGMAYIVDKELKDVDASKIPVLLKNSRFSKLFEPITKLFALPHYAEFDLTPFFAPFFVMFFGLCMADTGYGVVMLIGSLFGLIKGPKQMKPLIILVTILSLSTIFWGALTGTTFGLNLFETQLPVLSNLATFTSDHTFYLALLIGLFQILFGMAVQMFNRIHQGTLLDGVSTLGWMILVVFLTTSYLGQQPMPENTFAIGQAVLDFSHSVPAEVGKWGMIVGVILVLFFNDMKVNIFMRFGKGLWELYGITGVFGDLLSYIRLFALGISSAILGTVINSIGSQFLEIGIPGLSHVLFLAFVIIGHTTNLGLSMLGSFVHPLRLTFVEFYKNAGFAGGGKPYSPLRKNFTNN